MTEIQLKELLKNYQAIQMRVNLLKDYFGVYGNNQELLFYKKQKFQIKVITDMLSILSVDEKFVIEKHLIHHHTWVETTQLFGETFGKSNEKSERTLKRIQSRVLKKLVNLIGDALDGDFIEMDEKRINYKVAARYL